MDPATAHSRLLHKQSGGGGRSPAAGGPERTIKRSTFSPEQLRVLEEAFGANPLPNLATRHALAEELGLTPRTVQVWFQNRRQKVKKMQLASGSTSNDTVSSATERDSPLGMPRNSSTGSFELLNAEFERLNHSPCSEPLDCSPPSGRGAFLPRAALQGGGEPDEARYVSLWAHGGGSGSGGGCGGGGGGEAERDYMEPMPPNFSRTYQSLLGARLDGGVDEPSSGEAEHRLAGASLPALSEYRLQLMQHLAAVDPSLGMGGAGGGARGAPGADGDDECGCASPHSCAADGDGAGEGGANGARPLGGLDGQGFDTLDAAANLLLFSATAALIHGPRRAQLTKQGVGT